MWRCNGCARGGLRGLPQLFRNVQKLFLRETDGEKDYSRRHHHAGEQESKKHEYQTNRCVCLGFEMCEKGLFTFALRLKLTQPLLVTDNKECQPRNWTVKGLVWLRSML